MKTSVTGFPRIGKLRELKFAEEKYFRKEISHEELMKVADILKKEHLSYQKKAGIDLIPSNDFSLYDHILDTAFMLNVIPKRYHNLLGSPEFTRGDLYFAMARGYQGSAGDVAALPMKKWFNTNYHYIVPELEDDTKIFLADKKPVEEFRSALSDGVLTKPVLTGPYTFLSLCKCNGAKTAFDFAGDVINAYAELFAELDNAGARWVELDEPALVRDLDDSDKKRFCDIYKDLLGKKGSLKIMLGTFFGDIRDCYEEVTGLDFDGIGMDFVEGRESLRLLEEHGFPGDKTLFAGLVNGKNIWRCDYKKILAITDKIKEKAENVVISTSCSLLHVPYTVKQEDGLDENVVKRFSFALEKLDEIKELAVLAQTVDREKAPGYFRNRQIFEEDKSAFNESVREMTSSLKDADFERKPERSERSEVQREVLPLPALPTTTIGSFPQTAEVKANRSAYKKGEIDKKAYDKKVKEFIADCIRLQEEIGLDVLVHGEFERNDMVEFFGENLEGFVFTKKAWVQSYGTRCVKPPVIFGDVKREKNITADYITFAQGLTSKPVKGMLTGPVTILNWSFPREDVSLKEQALQIALAIREEVMELESRGIRIIQIDEAALREKLPLRKSDRYSEYLDWAIPAFRLCHSTVKPETQIHTHMCYSEFGDIIKEIDNMDADVISFEASRSDMAILESLAENDFRTQAGPGVYDIHSPRVPSVEELEERINAIISKLDHEKVWVNPDCGLKTRGLDETVASLKNMVVAAKNVRGKYV